MEIEGSSGCSAFSTVISSNSGIDLNRALSSDDLAFSFETFLDFRFLNRKLDSTNDKDLLISLTLLTSMIGLILRVLLLEFNFSFLTLGKGHFLQYLYFQL